MYLIPNRTFSKKGLRGGKIESKDEYLKLTPGDLKVMEKNIPGLKLRKIVVDNKPEIVEPKEKGKSDARITLEKEAGELEIEFTDRTSGKDLSALIEAKKAELEK
jgi:hypothetical protein